MVLNEGPFCDDQVTAEYLGAVMASSRSTVERDDRGAAFLSLLTRLSSYQIRAHYVLYQTVQVLFSGADEGTSGYSLAAYIPETAFNQAMDFADDEAINVRNWLPG